MSSRCADMLSRIAAVVTSGRAADPTAPAIVLVSTGSEAQALKLSLARADLTVLHVGVNVQTINNIAAQLALVSGASPGRAAEPYEVNDSVRRASQDGYFKTLSGLRGVTSDLQAALMLWDCAKDQVRSELLSTADRLEADRDRLAAVVAMHTWVSQDLAERGLALPGTVLAEPIDPLMASSFVWVDSTVTHLNPAQRNWLERLAAITEVHRIDPGDHRTAPGSDEAVVKEIVGTVDPADEAILAARRVTAALENGTAARDIVVAIASPEQDRYAEQIGSALRAARVPNDHGSVGEKRLPGDGASTRLWDTPTGRVMSAVFDAVQDVRKPRDLRMDHLRLCLGSAGMLDDENTRLEKLRSRVWALWEQARGTDPATWSQTLGVGGGDEPAAACLRDFAGAIVALSAAHSPNQVAWTELAKAVSLILGRVRSTSKADATCQQRLRVLLGVWASRSDTTNWSQAREDLAAVLDESSSDPGGGVRLIGLGSAWASLAEAVIVVGLADDQLPGVKGAVGPLTAEEVLRLRAAGGGAQQATDDGQEMLRALFANCGQVWLSFPRSDQLRTVKREPSRFLNGLPCVEQMGSVGSHYRQVDSGKLGLLGESDACAAMLRAGVPTTDPAIRDLIPIDLSAAVSCAQSRRAPGTADGIDGAFDLFNGDVRSVALDFPTNFSPDFKGEKPAGASPSATESLLDCPLSWWAQRMIKISDPEQWDPAEMDPRAFGSWLHASFEKLSSQHRLLDINLDAAAIEATLWEAVGGAADGSPPNSEGAAKGLEGFRYRISEQDVQRAATAISKAAARLADYLAGLGGSLGAVEERNLGPFELPLDSGPPLALSGRVDRIDDLPDGAFLVTDFKTGAAGSGFQLAVYAWLRTVSDRGGLAHLLYATTRAGKYKPVELLDGGREYDEQELCTYLVERLDEPVWRARAGIFASKAGADDHDRYCPVCGDLVPVAGGFGSRDRSERALALAKVTRDRIDLDDAGLAADDAVEES